MTVRRNCFIQLNFQNAKPSQSLERLQYQSFFKRYVGHYIQLITVKLLQKRRSMYYMESTLIPSGRT